MLWSLVKHDSVQGFSDLRRETDDVRVELKGLIEKEVLWHRHGAIAEADKKLERLQQIERDQAKKLATQHAK